MRQAVSRQRLELCCEGDSEDFLAGTPKCFPRGRFGLLCSGSRYPSSHEFGSWPNCLLADCLSLWLHWN
jgi:hypothetical protein